MLAKATSSIQWKEHRINQVLSFLAESRKKLYRTHYAAFTFGPILAKHKLPGTYTAALRDLKIIDSVRAAVGKGKAQDVKWISSSEPDENMAIQVLAAENAIQKKYAEERRGKEGGKVRKLKPLNTRKKHNPGTVLTALHRIYEATQSMEVFNPASFLEKYELDNTTFEKLVIMEYVLQHGNAYKWLKEPDGVCAELIYDEFYTGVKRKVIEHQEDILKAMVELRRLLTAERVITKEALRALLAKHKIYGKHENEIRDTVLRRANPEEALNVAGLKNYPHSKFYKWNFDAPALNMELAVKIHTGKKEEPKTMTTEALNNLPEASTIANHYENVEIITPLSDKPTFKEVLLHHVNTAINGKKITGHRIKPGKITIYFE